MQFYGDNKIPASTFAPSAVNRRVTNLELHQRLPMRPRSQNLTSTRLTWGHLVSTHHSFEPWVTLGMVDRIAKVVTKRRMDTDDTSWVDYWRTRPVAERLAMATELSKECVDGDPRQGLRRVHRVLRQP